MKLAICQQAYHADVRRTARIRMQALVKPGVDGGDDREEQQESQQAAEHRGGSLFQDRSISNLLQAVSEKQYPRHKASLFTTAILVLLAAATGAHVISANLGTNAFGLRFFA